MTQMLVDRYQDRLSCFDRIVITGTLPTICYAAGMTSFLYQRDIRVFDYPRFAEPLRDRIRVRAQELAEKHAVQIEHIAKAHIRKEDVVAKVLERRGGHPGLVHVISAMEACASYKPWHDKQTHKTFLKPDSGKCLTTTSTSWTKRSACATCACRPGVRSGSSSTATAMAGWRGG